MRLLALTLGSLVIIGILILTVRFWGLGRTQMQFESTYFNQALQADEYEVIIPWEQSYFLEQNPNWILWVDVYRGDEDVLLAKPWIERNKPNRDLEQKPSPTRPALSELLQQHQNSRFVLNITDNKERIHLQLQSLIEKLKAEERILITSDFSVIIDATKTLLPRVLYGSAPQDVVRLKTLESLWVLPAATLDADVLISALQRNKIDLISLEMTKEMKRRNKKTFLGPLTTKEEVLKAKALRAEGLFVSDPLLLQ
jgi:hypothetical protein